MPVEARLTRGRWSEANFLLHAAPREFRPEVQNGAHVRGRLTVFGKRRQPATWTSVVCHQRGDDVAPVVAKKDGKEAATGKNVGAGIQESFRCNSEAPCVGWQHLHQADGPGGGERCRVETALLPNDRLDQGSRKRPHGRYRASRSLNLPFVNSPLAMQSPDCGRLAPAPTAYQERDKTKGLR